MKLLFLDFDGVLNSTQYASQRTRTSLFGTLEDLDPVACGLLKTFLNSHPDLKVVVSSTWRKYYDLPGLKKLFNQSGLDGDKILGVTPVIHNQVRGVEIQSFLDTVNCESFVILDDDADMGHLLPFLVQTDVDLGLQPQDLVLATKILIK